MFPHRAPTVLICKRQKSEKRKIIMTVTTILEASPLFYAYISLSGLSKRKSTIQLHTYNIIALVQQRQRLDSLHFILNRKILSSNIHVRSFVFSLSKKNILLLSFVMVNNNSQHFIINKFRLLGGTGHIRVVTFVLTERVQFRSSYNMWRFTISPLMR